MNKGFEKLEKDGVGIPIVVGVTGHRALRESDMPRLRQLVSQELKKLMGQYPNSEFVLLDAIASGADTICAQVALEVGMKLVCPVPMPIEEYRNDFSGDDAVAFGNLIKRASSVFTAPDTEPSPDTPTRDFHYRQAGIYIATHCHVLMALWDGAHGSPAGCGTAEVVDFMLRGDFGGESCFKAKNDGAVIHILTPRQGSQAEMANAARLIEGERGSLSEMLLMTDGFNADAGNFVCGETADTLLPDDVLTGANARTKKLRSLYSAADGLSVRFQNKYLSAVKWFSTFGVLLVLFFLFYDELECNLFLLCYGALILIYALAFFLVRRGKSHAKYLQYRVLAETLRVQFYLSAAGLSDNIGGAFTWTQKQDSTWIKQAVSALLIGVPKESAVPFSVIKESWIDAQLAYHQRALPRDYGKHRVSALTEKLMLIASVSLFVGVLVLEFFFEPLMTRELFPWSFPSLFMHHEGQAFTLRSLLKILLGGVSASTIFLSGFYGKLSFERKSIDHRKMAGLYASAKERFERDKTDKKQLFRELAREEIVENGDWFSYCTQNPPSFNV